MSEFSKIITAIIVIGFVFYLGKQIKMRPDLLTKENLAKSFGSMGVLALLLMAFIGFLILVLRRG